MALWGQSAGANAVGNYSYAYSDKDILVSGLIADSGAASTTAVANYTNFSTFAGYFGCGGLKRHGRAGMHAEGRC